MTWFATPDDAVARLRDAGYLADPATATTAYLAATLEKPLPVEGPADVGRTELAKAVSRASGAELVRLQCYEGLDEARALSGVRPGRRCPPAASPWSSTSGRSGRTAPSSSCSAT